MQEFPTDITFYYPWRSYQKEVLQHLETHLNNGHLHLVAPPGSGKTVLGLEVMLRLNKPTLIVAPTLAIRNQWVNRFRELFLQVKKKPEWISTDLYDPKFMTVTTYQGLHALFKEDDKTEPEENVIDDAEEEMEQIVQSEKKTFREKFFQQQFETIVLDEAHHLRTSWWKTSLYVKNKLKNPAIVALTATPPYDVDQSEWDKYIELCGPIDEEIEVAALVKEGDLCPHQDYVWMSAPTKKEMGPIDAFHKEAEELRKGLLHNTAFKTLIETHPWMQSEKYVEEKLGNHGYFISMILYLKEIGSTQWEMPFELIDEKAKHLPSFDLDWTEELLTALFYQDELVDPGEEPLKSIKKQLSNIGALEHRKVKLNATKSMERTLLHSASKLESINKIVSLERQAQGDKLRLVILADYIYADDLPKNADEKKPLIRLGVIPIFENIRKELGSRCRLGVLTGSVVILPRDIIPLLEKHHLSFSTETLPHDAEYVKVTWQGTSRQYMVRVITDIFSKGKIDVLVGTTALLGEGWDAPSVNTLILASYVGTFMLTNQMRGRAIRTEPGNPDKTANIWHLICVDPKSADGGYDFHALKRRFRSLSGLDEELPLIVSGLNRLRLPVRQFTRDEILTVNNEMTGRATNRKRLFSRWQEAVNKGEEKREEALVDPSAVPRPFVFRNTLKSLLTITLVTVINVLRGMGNQQHHYRQSDDLIIQLIAGLIIGIILSSPFWWKALKIFIKNASVESSMREIGNAVYHTLYKLDLIQTPISQNKVYADASPDGEVVCYLENGTKHEQKLFLQSLQEIVDPIENPRYLLHRKSGSRLWVRHDYHAIPEEIGRRKENAETLLAEWKKRVGQAELIYTRTPEGRKKLLKARVRAMSGQFVKRSERISVWR
jgi:superfamily II DNA or RNA helicase